MEKSGFQIDEEEGIDLRKWFFRILDNWLLFGIFIFLSVLTAYIVNTFSKQEYEIRTRVLIKEEANPLDKANVVKLTLNTDPYRLKNEIGIINSSLVKKRTIKELDFYIEYYCNNRFEIRELYHNSPFLVWFDVHHQQPVNLVFNVKFLSDSILFLEAKGEDISLYNYITDQQNEISDEVIYADTVSYNDTVESEAMRFVLQRNPIQKIDDTQDKYSFIFRSLPYLLARYGDINTEIPNGSSIMTVSIRHNNPLKGSEFLNRLVSNYLNRGIERENRVAQLTIDFIDLQLTSLGDSLKVSEQKLEDFRSEHKLVNVDYKAQQAYSRQNALESQKAGLIMEKRYLVYLSENLMKENIAFEDLIAPSTLGITDPVLNNLVMELVEMYSERTELTLNTRKNNPYINSLDLRIESVKNKLAETVKNLLEATEISIEEVDAQNAVVSERLSKLPRDQRELLNFQRRFELNDELYTYLLTRRSEMQIKKASTLPSNEILEEATPQEAILVKPNKKMNYVLACLLGILFPFITVYIRVSLNQSIQSHDDIKEITRKAIIGTIIHNDNIELPAVVKAPASILAESFRMLRANLQFIVADSVSPVMVISSAMKGEGKSFVAINLAAVYASYGKKVCLVDLDLRRPKLAEYLSVPNEVGMSNCLIGQAKIENIKIAIEDANFDLYPSGPIPPNPSELVASDRLNEILKKLQSKYEIVILDTPPIGIVSDAVFIRREAGYLLLVIRNNVSNKHLLSALLEELERNQVQGINLVYNDILTSKNGYYRYGYRYGNYYDSNKKSIWSRFGFK